MEITQINDHKILREPKGEGTTAAGHTGDGKRYYKVSDGGSVFGVVKGCPSGATLQVAMRREGESTWVIQPDHINLLTPSNQSWGALNTMFGDAADAGQVSEIAAIVTHEQIPPGTIPRDVISPELLAWSDSVYVVKGTGVTVSISSVNGTPVLGDAIYRTFDEAPVGITSSHLPKGAVIGIAVEPVYPERTKGGAHWVMDNSIGEAEGEISGAFGDPCKHLFYEFDVSAFIVFPREFPPRGSPLDSEKWESYEKDFIAESRPLRVIKWEKEFQILTVGDFVTGQARPCRLSPVGMAPGTGFTAGAPIRSERADIRGTASRPLADGEALRVVCIPDNGDPWLAGLTTQLLPGGEWVVYAAQLAGPSHSKSFILTAVISRFQPPRWDADSIRQWLAISEVSQNSVLVTLLQFVPVRSR